MRLGSIKGKGRDPLNEGMVGGSPFCGLTLLTNLDQLKLIVRFIGRLTVL